MYIMLFQQNVSHPFTTQALNLIIYVGEAPHPQYVFKPLNNMVISFYTHLFKFNYIFIFVLFAY